jgi:hypothetical protein
MHELTRSCDSIGIGDELFTVDATAIDELSDRQSPSSPHALSAKCEQRPRIPSRLGNANSSIFGPCVIVLHAYAVRRERPARAYVLGVMV